MLNSIKKLKGKKINTNISQRKEEEEIKELEKYNGGVLDLNPRNDFKFEDLSEEVSRDFIEYERRINHIVHGSMIEVGKVLYEANQKYSNNGNGIYGRWVQSVGYSIKTASRIVSVYRYWEELDEVKKKILQELPITLAYQVSSKNTEEELVNKVMSGEILTSKEYKKQVEELKNISEKDEGLKEETENENEDYLLEMVELEKRKIRNEEGIDVEEISEELIGLIANKTFLMTEAESKEKELTKIYDELEKVESRIKTIREYNTPKLFDVVK